MSHGNVGIKIGSGAITDGGSRGRFEGTVIDDVFQGSLVHFVYRICRG